ncbi:LytTR family DNA-binding domain-containing protein [Phenylobacterium kunshanense]|uniref:HTH LytTR-type domain-containing protein n=1 Tax=Phenylobacterium kunshanense TaxID=1445034 RepID=A0A328BJG6_9CAUL|nr:LytTR family DNA-binding domain-containing protein [Phenylobacterium kunshanense]RAK67460.1 hypothetical protein DJ019_05985 [Phenylobacterium kunshanense]
MTRDLRESPRGAVHASWVATAWSVVQRSLIPAIVVGAFLAFIGAFGSGGMPMGLRVPFMIAISFVGTVLGQTAYLSVEQVPWVAARWWRIGLFSGLAMCVPMGLFVWSVVGMLEGPRRGFDVSELPAYVGVSLVTSLFFCVTVAWAHTLAPERGQGEVAAAPPKFLERLPLKLRGAAVWAVEAEDHYLRLHTSKGQDLILLRLADAISELEGIEGMQVHRSWWVAREAIADARRADGRATLTLKDGSEVPVSRTYAGLLRDRGWI